MTPLFIIEYTSYEPDHTAVAVSIGVKAETKEEAIKIAQKHCSDLLEKSLQITMFGDYIPSTGKFEKHTEKMDVGT